MADEAASWNDLHARYEVDRIDHGAAYSLPGGVHTNGAESFFSRLRGGKVGQCNEGFGHAVENGLRRLTH